MPEHNTTLIERNGGDTEVQKITLEVYRLGSGKTLVEVPSGTDWAELHDVLGGTGKKVTNRGEDVREKKGSPSDRDTVTVGTSHGKAGRS